jgi:hypothetical protein
MLNMLNDDSIFKYTLNTLYVQPSTDATEYKIIISNINKHNIEYTSETLTFACEEILTYGSCCKMTNKILIDECCKHKVVPNDECLKLAIRSKDLMFLDYCLTHICPDDYMLNYACENSDFSVMERMLDAKAIPSSKCFISVIQNKKAHTEHKKMIMLLLKHGGHINKLVLKWMVACSPTAIFPQIFDYDVSQDDYFDVCHHYCMIDDNETYLSFDTPIKKLYKMVHDEKPYDKIIEFKNNNNIEFDKYCYDLMFVSKNTQYEQIIHDAVSDKKYIPTFEALARNKCVVYTQNILENYSSELAFM